MLKKKFKQKCSKIRGQRVAQFGKSLNFNPVFPFELDAVIPADSLRQPRHKSACCLHDPAIFMAVLMTHLNRNGQIAGHISFLFTIFNKYEPGSKSEIKTMAESV